MRLWSIYGSPHLVFYMASIFPVTDEETPIAARPVGYEEHGQPRETIVTAMLAFISMETHSIRFPFLFLSSVHRESIRVCTCKVNRKKVNAARKSEITFFFK